jgi:hypothetical protein
MSRQKRNSLVVIPTRMGTVAEAFFQRCPIPRGIDLVHFRQVPYACTGETCEVFDTLLIDLRHDSDKLFSVIDKNARYEIRRAAHRDELTVELFEEPSSKLVSTFCDAYDGFAVTKRLPTISRRLIQAYASEGALRITSAHDPQRQCVVWHSYLQVTSRVRLLHSVSTHRSSNNPTIRAMYGRANRFLHWQDIEWFKKLGLTTYDLGGWYSGFSDSDRLAINAFKKQFGGTTVREYNCRRVLTWRGWMMLMVEALLNARLALVSYVDRSWDFRRSSVNKQ